MGSKKKRDSDSSDSSSESGSSDSDSSYERKKSNTKKHSRSSSEESSREKSKKTVKRKAENESDGEKRNKRHSEESKDRRSSNNYKSDKSVEDRHRDHKYDRYSDRNRSGKSSSGDYRNRDREDRGHKDDYRNKDKNDGRNRSFRDRDNRDRPNRDRGHDSRDYRDRRYNRDSQNSRGRKRRSRSSSFDHANAKWGRDDAGNSKSTEKKQEEKEKPNFGLSGKLTEETNTYRGIVIKYSEPPEARKPRRRWRLYPFKGEKALQTLYIHRESAYLIGRERKVVDLPVDHPSCSKQHAALQYRLVPFTREDGSTGKRVRPYIIDLESANGTFINNKKIEPRKYVELLEKDVIKFGFSSREYVLLHENSKDEALDDDVKQEEEELPVKEEPKN